jgi:hypothetical protein
MCIPSPKALQDMSSWQRCVCFTPRCQQQRWYVQRYDELHEVWRVTLAPGNAGWLVAASAPVCPFCGATLLLPEHGGAAGTAPNNWS